MKALQCNPRFSAGGGDIAKVLVCAAEHYKNGAKLWSESCGFKYLSASSKEEFLSQINDFCNKDYNAPVFFEVFVDPEVDKWSIGGLHRRYKTDINTVPEKISLLEQIFSVKNEKRINKKYKVVRFFGTKFKFKVKMEKNT